MLQSTNCPHNRQRLNHLPADVEDMDVDPTDNAPLCSALPSPLGVLDECPPEIRNMIYEAFLSDCQTKSEITVTKCNDGKIIAEVKDGVTVFEKERKFVYYDNITPDGQSRTLACPLVYIRASAPDILSLASAFIWYRALDHHSLRQFSAAYQTFLSHPIHRGREYQLHISFNLWEEYDSTHHWTLSKPAHGRNTTIDVTVRKWFEAACTLPASAQIHLVFRTFWRDLRSLRHQSMKSGFSKRNLTFTFEDGDDVIDERPFFETQTIAAIKELDVPEQADISPARRNYYVDHGCRGFDTFRRML